ncbi:MAG TPA: type I pullulanase, partial [Subdoligranulum sp.]|nr:type I pullulanase [Subdoligranulum sp.]
GFRFDLMALEDVDTMNAIRAALDSLPGGESILLYGEPWMGGGTNLEGGARPADKRALDALHERIGFFCDDTRDCIKGNVFDAANAGYVNGAPQHGYDVLHSISAWRSGAHGFWPKRAGQVVQYVSAHDNYTLWDKLAAVG